MKKTLLTLLITAALLTAGCNKETAGQAMGMMPKFCESDIACKEPGKICCMPSMGSAKQCLQKERCVKECAKNSDCASKNCDITSFRCVKAPQNMPNLDCTNDCGTSTSYGVMSNSFSDDAKKNTYKTEITSYKSSKTPTTLCQGNGNSIGIVCSDPTEIPATPGGFFIRWCCKPFSQPTQRSSPPK